MIPLYPEFFNDVFGPVMQPGSSSHLAGPCRIGRLARHLLGAEPHQAVVVLDPSGSFAGTFGLMDEDLGFLSGILGFSPDDPRIFSAKDEALSRGLTWRFDWEPVVASSHANAALVRLTGGGHTVELVANSTGGGMVEVVAVQGFPVGFRGDTAVVLVFEGAYRPDGVLDEGIVVLPGGEGEGGPTLRWFQTLERGDLPPGVLGWNAILPVVTHPDRKPQLFTTMAEWRRLADEAGVGLAEIALRYEESASAWPRSRVVSAMEDIRRVLHRQVHAAYDDPAASETRPFSRRDDRLWPARWSGGSFSGNVQGHALKLVLGVNAKVRGVPIVPGPMGTGGGYLYSALYAVQQARGFSDEALLRGLFVAAGVGAIAYTRTEPTGEVIGCAGECGVCSAMAAVAITEMAGGSGSQVEHAASFAIQAMTGLPCDPIPGGLEQPCFSRIVSAVTNAIAFADLALAGSDAVLPFHEALDAADRVGRALAPELKCTSLGGCCATPTGRRLAAAFRGQMQPPTPTGT